MQEKIATLARFIRKGENRSAAAFLIKFYEECPCKAYADACMRVLLVESVRMMNHTVCGFYCDEMKLAEELFSCGKLCIESVIDDICRQAKDAARADKQRIFNKAVSYINERFADNQLSIGDVAQYVGVAHNVLVRMFSENVGVTPGEYLGKLRISRSIESLKNMSVNETALSVGFTSGEGYIRTFKKFMGTTPGEWKRKNLFL